MAYSTRSTQTTAQDCDVREHENDIETARPSGSTRRKRKQLRIMGATKSCGVFSPQKKPPVIMSDRGDFHCPRCDSQLNDHPSHVKRAAPATKSPHTLSTGPSTAAASERSTQGNVRIGGQAALGVERAVGQATPLHVPNDMQIEISAPISTRRATQLDSNTHAPTLTALPEVRPAIKDNALIKNNALSSGENSEFDHPKTPFEHRTTAGNGLSDKTLKRLQETGDWKYTMGVEQDRNEAQDEETGIPEDAYQYSVQKRQWLETEEDAIESSAGPFHTMSEANTVARMQVQRPQIDGLEGNRSKEWSYYFKQDENGMGKHLATVLNIHIETIVRRGKCRFSGLFPKIPS